MSARALDGGVQAAQFSLEKTQEFHRRIAAIVADVQAGIWGKGTHDLVGYATDFGLGQRHGIQTLVLKTARKSAYVRLHWDLILGDSTADSDQRRIATQNAITELA